MAVPLSKQSAAARRQQEIEQKAGIGAQISPRFKTVEQSLPPSVPFTPTTTPVVPEPSYRSADFAGKSQTELFSLALTDLLKQQQNIERFPFRGQEFAAQGEQIRRQISTPGSLIGAAPGLQAQVRGAAAGAVEPTIRGAQQAGQTFQSRLENFENILNTYTSLLKQAQEQELAQRELALREEQFAQPEGPIEVSPGATLFDPITGAPLFTAPTARQISGTGTTAAGAAGVRSVSGVSRAAPGVVPGKLSSRTQQVYDNPALISNYTPTERGKILDEIAESGLDTSRLTLANVNATQRDQVALFDEIENEADLAKQKYATGIDTGPISSRFQALQAVVGRAPEFTELRSIIDNMGSILLRMRSGAAVTPQEFERIKGFIPAINDDEKTAQTKITRFYAAIADAKQNYIKRSTQTSFQILQEQAGFGGTSQAGSTSSGLNYSIEE